jgi:hypothetical protein
VEGGGGGVGSWGRPDLAAAGGSPRGEGVGGGRASSLLVFLIFEQHLHWTIIPHIPGGPWGPR